MGYSFSCSVRVFRRSSVLRSKKDTREKCFFLKTDGLEVPCRPEFPTSEVRIPLKIKQILILKISNILGFSIKSPWKSLATDSNVLFKFIVNCTFVLLPVDQFCCVDLNSFLKRTELESKYIIEKPFLKRAVWSRNYNLQFFMLAVERFTPFLQLNVCFWFWQFQIPIYTLHWTRVGIIFGVTNK